MTRAQINFVKAAISAAKVMDDQRWRDGPGRKADRDPDMSREEREMDRIWRGDV